MPLQIIPDPLALLRPVSKTVQAAYTRPADTNVYASGDVLAESTSAATILTFASCARANGLGFLVDGATLIFSTAPTTKPDLELWLFDTAITMQNDNVAWNPTDADLEKCLGVIKFPGVAVNAAAVSGGNGNGMASVAADIKSRAAAAASTSLFGVVVVRSAYTPASAEKFSFRLHLIQD